MHIRQPFMQQSAIFYERRQEFESKLFAQVMMHVTHKPFFFFGVCTVCVPDRSVWVSDSRQPFVEHEGMSPDVLYMKLKRPLVIPCRVTHPNITTTLVKVSAQPLVLLCCTSAHILNVFYPFFVHNHYFSLSESFTTLFLSWQPSHCGVCVRLRIRVKVCADVFVSVGTRALSDEESLKSARCLHAYPCCLRKVVPCTVRCPFPVKRRSLLALVYRTCSFWPQAIIPFPHLTLHFSLRHNSWQLSLSDALNSWQGWNRKSLWLLSALTNLTLVFNLSKTYITNSDKDNPNTGGDLATRARTSSFVQSREVPNLKFWHER